MIMDRRRVLSLAAASAISPFVAVESRANAYPTRPVRLLVGFAPGGTTDIAARLIGQWLQERLGQPFVIENRPGASTNLATEAVVRSPADGYTLLVTSTNNFINAGLFPQLNYNFIRDIAPIAGIMRTPLVLEVHPSIPVATVTEFIAYAKANPGKINMGNFGTGTVSHLAAELFKTTAGVDYVHVPYRGSGPMLPDLLAGRLHAAFDNLPASIEHIKAGTLRPLAVTTATRSQSIPSVPTVAESVQGFEVSAAFGVAAPRQTPAAVIELLNKEINAGLANPQLKGKLTDLGGLLLPGSPAEFEQLALRETEKWTKLIKASSIKAE